MAVRGLASIDAIMLGALLASGVSAMAVAIGILFILIGLGIRDVSRRTVAAEPEPAG